VAISALVSKSEADALVNKYVPGHDVKVFYRPSNPKFCFLEAQTPVLAYVMIAFGFLLLIPGGGLAFFFLIFGGGPTRHRNPIATDSRFPVSESEMQVSVQPPYSPSAQADLVEADLVDADLVGPT